MAHNRSKKTGLTSAVIRQRCPRCRRGIVFRRHIAMNVRCPVCGLEFEREPGYFTGAIYVGLAFSFPVTIILFFLLVWLFPGLDIAVAGGLAALGFIPLAPLTIRLSRVIWISIDRSFMRLDTDFPDAPPPDPPEPDEPVKPDAPTETRKVSEREPEHV